MPEDTVRIQWMSKTELSKEIILTIENYQEWMGEKMIQDFTAPGYNSCAKCKVHANRDELENASSKRGYISCCIQTHIELSAEEIQKLHLNGNSALHGSELIAYPACMFLKKRKCSIYKDRPYRCRLFPYSMKNKIIRISSYCSNPEFFAYYFFTHQSEVLNLLLDDNSPYREKDQAPIHRS